MKPILSLLTVCFCALAFLAVNPAKVAADSGGHGYKRHYDQKHGFKHRRHDNIERRFRDDRYGFHNRSRHLRYDRRGRHYAPRHHYREDYRHRYKGRKHRHFRRHRHHGGHSHYDDSHFSFGFSYYAWPRYGYRSYYDRPYLYRPYYPPRVIYTDPPASYAPQPYGAAPIVQAPPPIADLPSDCLMIREYQTQITVGGRLVDAYGDACMKPDGSWERGPPKAVPDY
jgi:hypothetical protein